MHAAAASATPFPVWASPTSETPLNLGIEWDAENRLQALLPLPEPVETARRGSVRSRRTQRYRLERQSQTGKVIRPSCGLQVIV